MKPVKLLLASAMTLAVAAPIAADPPIVQPGAPGQAPRTLTPSESRGLARSGFSAADVEFMQHMIVHHGQAVEMGELVAGRTRNPQVALMADRIARSQASEIEMMRAWLYRRNQSQEMAHDGSGAGGHAGHAISGQHAMHGAPSETPLMPGMLSPAQMMRLGEARDDAFDRLYLTGMIHHHQGAIDMVEALMATPGNGEDPQLSEFLSAIIADQSAEIARMRGLLAGL